MMVVPQGVGYLLVPVEQIISQHEHGILPVLVVGVGAGNLVGHIHHQGVFCRFRRRRRARRGVGGHSGGREEQLLCVAPRDAVRAQTVLGLEGFDGGLCYLIITAGYLGVVEPQLGQTGLNLRDQFAGVAVFDRLSEGKIVGKGFFNRRGRFVGA